MSVPMELIFCDRCDFSSSTMVAWGHFEYRLPDGRRLSVHRELGWCSDCNDIKPVEDLSDRDEGEKRILELENLLRKSALPGFVDRMIFWRQKPDPRKEFLLRELEEELARRALLATRRSAPRCLRCGSPAIVQLPQTYRFGENKAAEMGFLHPDCGGSLWIKESGVSVAMQFLAVRIYDGEGRLVGKEDVK